MGILRAESLLVTIVGESDIERDITLGFAKIISPAPFANGPIVGETVEAVIFIVKMNCYKLPLTEEGTAPNVFKFAEFTLSVIAAVENTV